MLVLIVLETIGSGYWKNILTKQPKKCYKICRTGVDIMDRSHDPNHLVSMTNCYSFSVRRSKEKRRKTKEKVQVKGLGPPAKALLPSAEFVENHVLWLQHKPYIRFVFKISTHTGNCSLGLETQEEKVVTQEKNSQPTDTHALSHIPYIAKL